MNSLLSLSTFSLLTFSLFLSRSSFISFGKTCHVLASSLVALFLPQRCLLSHPRDAARSFLVQLLSRTVANKCIECKLSTNFFQRFVLAHRVHARACISLLGDICSQLFHNELALQEISQSTSGFPDAILQKNAYCSFLSFPFLSFVSNGNAPMTNVELTITRNAVTSAASSYLSFLSHLIP